MRALLYAGYFLLYSANFLSQSSIEIKNRVEWDSINHCEVIWDSTKIISKEINTDLFSYKANYQFKTKSFVSAQLHLPELFSPIETFLDSILKKNIEIEFPYYNFRVENERGYSYVFKVKHQGERHTIFRDCGCGTWKGMRITGGRFSGYNNQLFNRNIYFHLKSRNRYGNNQRQINFFEFKLENGIPTKYVTFQDTIKLDKIVLLKNGLVINIESHYPNGNLMYKASLFNGKLQGDFVYWNKLGEEILKVKFNKNKIEHVVTEQGYFYWNEMLEIWQINY